MPLTVGQTFKMDRAQVAYTDTYGGVKTVIAKGATIIVEGVYPTRVALRIEGDLYEVTKEGSYGLSMACMSPDYEGWKWDSKKDVFRRPLVGVHRIMEVRTSVALRLLRNAS